MSNQTKLTPEERQTLKHFKEDNKDHNLQLFHFPDYLATVAIGRVIPGGDWVLVSTANCSDGEKKYRKRVGEFKAASRWVWGEGIKVYCPRQENWQVLAEKVAELSWQ